MASPKAHGIGSVCMPAEPVLTIAGLAQARPQGETDMMLEIKNLHARVEGKEILRGIDLDGRGRRGSRHHGAERLRQEHAGGVLAGRDAYEVTEGSVASTARTCWRWRPEERAREGIFLAFQYPVEIPGVSNTYFLQGRLNAIRKHRGQQELDAVEFLKLMTREGEAPAHRSELLNRPVNEGFSGGEKKRNEIFQMAVLEPRLAILDETDSGLDIDALRRCRRRQRPAQPERAILVVTHYQRLLNYIVPDFVHVLVDGRIVQSGGKELALELEAKGYGWIEDVRQEPRVTECRAARSTLRRSRQPSRASRG